MRLPDVMLRLLAFLVAVAVSGCAADTAPAAGSNGGAADTSGVHLVDVPTSEALMAEIERTGAEGTAATIVVNLWATWCPPCIAEFPMLVTYAAETDSVAVRFVSVDAERDRDAVVRFVANQGVTDPTYLYTGAEDLPSQLNPLFPGGAIPVTMVFAADGTLEYTHVGAISREELEEIVASAVGARS